MKKLKSAVEIYINTGEREENKRIFDLFFAKKAEIEQAFGDGLVWERLDEKKASRVRFVLTQGGLVEEDKWAVIQDAMIDAMDKLAKAVKPQFSQS